MKLTGTQVFTHTDDGEDWSKTYPFTIIACQFGKRVYLEYPLNRLTDLIEDVEYTEQFSTQFVITPNGQCFKRHDFREAWEIAVGLTVPYSDDELADMAEDQSERDKGQGPFSPGQRNLTAEYMAVNPPPSPNRRLKP